MKKLLDLIVKTVFDMANFALLLGLFIYIYALLGMQFFANRLKVKLNTPVPRKYQAEVFIAECTI